MQHSEEVTRSPVFGLRYLEDREVEGVDIVGCLIIGGNTATNTGSGCDDADVDAGYEP